MKKISLLLFVLVLFQCKSPQVTAQQPTTEEESLSNPPKLVVGIVIDQMRYDYLTRFWKRFHEDGFKRLVREGYTFKNNHFNYVPTYTGPGHTSIYTGTSPSNHGIISNNWYDKVHKTSVYCAEDDAVNPVGTTSDAGKMSPHRMKTTTFADQNKLHTQFRGKTIGIALKDRGAILPAGHTADAAYWFYGADEGKFITSSFYRENLPQWVVDFNRSGKVAGYLTTWDTQEPIDTYIESTSDNNHYEHGFKGKKEATFPYDLANLKSENGNFDIIKTTPFGNSLTTDFAIAAIQGEQLGADEITDVLTVSFSSPDYIGHNFGVSSKEQQDNYMRLDQDIARLLQALDKEVGKGEYTVFLTSDHGGIEVPAYMRDHGIPAGYFKTKAFKKDLNAFVSEQYKGLPLVENVSNNQIFIDKALVVQKHIDFKQLQDNIKNFLLGYNNIDKVYTRDMLAYTNYNTGTGWLVQNGFNQKRSGDVVYVFDPGYISYPEKGSTHGSSLNYDTHSPLIFFGKGIQHGETTQKSYVIDIAPTISVLLGTAFPSGATGKVLYQVFE